MQTIKYTFNPDGTVKIETFGFSGAACQQATKDIEKLLGTKVADTPTNEMYQTTKEHLTQRNA